MKTCKRSTFDREMADPEFRKKFEAEYDEFALSEILLELMEERKISVRKLAAATGLSPSVVQDIRSATRSNITIKSFLKVMHALDSEVAVKVGRRYVKLVG